ncbi:MAG: hypothetical protein B6244_14925 [Candidatus Cloacimonetes bacterium 4572_55]|nr:MAG: hypothetical protein B6244_14925 [Candidatus Cloacimonetes bacterium 4572_55]
MERSGKDRREQVYCPSHERNEEAISKLIASCATNGAQIKMLIWALGLSAMLMMTVITGVVGFTAYTYKHGETMMTVLDARIDGNGDRLSRLEKIKKPTNN